MPHRCEAHAAEQLAADLRGIALQTVIIMVVLLAIAGGVAAVLLNRGGEAVTDIERQQISRQASEFSGSSLCKAAGFVWSSATSSCNAAAAVVSCYSTSREHPISRALRTTCEG